MKQLTKDKWHDGGIAGLAVGLIPVAYFAIDRAFNLTADASGKIPVIVTIFDYILWIAKFAGGIMLMKWFLKRFSRQHSDADRRDIYTFGLIISLLSSLIMSGGYLAYTTLVEPDLYQQSMEVAMAANPQLFNSSTVDAMDEIIPQLPTMMFWGYLIYGFIWGMILSSIFSKKIFPSNPFMSSSKDDDSKDDDSKDDDSKDDDQDEKDYL